jgi:hypothetical protein
VEKSRRTVDRIAALRASGSSGLLSPTETFAQTDWKTWQGAQHRNSRQTIFTLTYFLIPSTGTGTLGTKYGETDYGYDALERKNRAYVWASAATTTRTVRLHRRAKCKGGQKGITFIFAERRPEERAGKERRKPFNGRRARQRRVCVCVSMPRKPDDAPAVWCTT